MLSFVYDRLPLVKTPVFKVERVGTRVAKLYHQVDLLVMTLDAIQMPFGNGKSRHQILGKSSYGPIVKAHYL